MAVFWAATLLVSGLLRARSHAQQQTCQVSSHDCARNADTLEAIDNDVHEVQLVQMGSDTVRQHAVLELNASLEAQTLAASPQAVEHGIAGCNCVGISWPGDATVYLNGAPTTYPADLGSRCEAWDLGRDPACSGAASDPAYCRQKWCFVDGCACNTSEVPKISSYLPNATFQGATLYYSYEACNSTDSWTASRHTSACVNQNTQAACDRLEKCSWGNGVCAGKELTVMGACVEPAPASIMGDEACRCVGISNLTGAVKALIQKRHYDYPAHFGSSCEAWDDGLHPLCEGTPKAYWCKQRWCYVDPCSCHIDVVPKRLTYMPDATFQNRPLFYSYRTCGEVDTYSSEENAVACPTRPSQYQCEQVTNCTWVGVRGCVHKDILSTCGMESLDLVMDRSASARTGLFGQIGSFFRSGFGIGGATG